MSNTASKHVKCEFRLNFLCFILLNNILQGALFVVTWFGINLLEFNGQTTIALLCKNVSLKIKILKTEQIMKENLYCDFKFLSQCKIRIGFVHRRAMFIF